MKFKCKDLMVGSLMLMSCCGVLFWGFASVIVFPVCLFAYSYPVAKGVLLLVKLFFGLLLASNMVGFSLVGLFLVNPSLWIKLHDNKEKLPFVKLIPDVFNFNQMYKSTYSAFFKRLTNEQSGKDS